MAQSGYIQRKHRAITGLVDAVRAAKCWKCGSLTTRERIINGWCVDCMAVWAASADPIMLEQARRGYAPQSCLSAPSSRQVERITEAIIEPKNDKDFLPLLLFLGNQTVGRMQALWNFVKTMEQLELKTSGEVFRLSQSSHDTNHRCGLHAPVQKTTLHSFFSRVFNSDSFEPIKRDKHLREYMRWFAEQNQLWTFDLTRISAVSERTRQAWRFASKIKWKPLKEHWPFLSDEQSGDHDVIGMVDAVIPKGIPEQWRQDMCQDLMVAVLSGEVTRENIRDMAPEFMKMVWQQHPLKYGALSLDAPAPWMAAGDTRTLADLLADVCLDVACCDKEEPEAEDEPIQGFSIGTILRQKNNGIAIEGLQLKEEWSMDSDVQAVYNADRSSKRTPATHRYVVHRRHAVKGAIL